jgi:hypothetical protein
MDVWKQIIRRQYGAAIKMLENAIRECPAGVWGDRVHWQAYWYIAYHTIFFLDFYLSETDIGFAPPAPFTLGELDPSGVLPERVYTKDELLAYLEHGRKKCRAKINALTAEDVGRDSGSLRPGVTVAELLLYSMRHVQHHAAQLNLILRQTIDSAPRWVSKVED